jgi:hypothetical protein
LYRPLLPNEPCPNCKCEATPSKKKLTVNTVDGQNTPQRKEFSPNLTTENYSSAAGLVRLEKKKTTQEGHEINLRQSTERIRKKSYLLVKLLASWFSLLIVAVLIIKWKFNDMPPVIVPQVAQREDDSKTFASRNLDVINQSASSIMSTAADFFAATAPEALAQSCIKRPRLVQTINNDGAKSTIFKPEKMPELIAKNVIHPAPAPMVETVWADSRGRKIELVFAQQGDHWLIDWESYAKSSAMPWPVFQAADGDDVGTFRLLVRERLVRSPPTESSLSVVFYEPGFLRGSALGSPSCDFIIDRRSKTGKMILAALKAKLENKPVFNSIFPENDPPNTARVHVKIRRQIVDDGKKFTLEELLACHWLGIEDPGIELTDTP